jgi:hypothetical protein
MRIPRKLKKKLKDRRYYKLTKSLRKLRKQLRKQKEPVAFRFEVIV